MNRRTVNGGPWDGHPIRIARKAHRCDYRNGPCGHRTIETGEPYVEGELNPYRAGGFGFDRYCFHCAGQEARATLEPERL